MKLSDLKKQLDAMYDLWTRRGQDDEIVIRIKLPYATIGGTPYVSVKGMYRGFDWDRGRMYIEPEQELTFHDKDFAGQMRDWQEKCDWLKIKNKDLEKENKKLKTQLEELKNEP